MSTEFLHVKQFVQGTYLGIFDSALNNASTAGFFLFHNVIQLRKKIFSESKPPIQSNLLKLLLHELEAVEPFHRAIKRLVVCSLKFFGNRGKPRQY
jgi:hypothetical protein